MEEQFVLRVPPSLAERLNQLLNDSSSNPEEHQIDLLFSEDGRTGTFSLGDEHFPANLLDLPCVVESYKTYDDSSLVKTADISQMIMVRETGDPAPDLPEYRHGLTPPMRDARKRRFRREPDLNPELVQRVEKDLVSIMSGGTIDPTDGEARARNMNKKAGNAQETKPAVRETVVNTGEPERSDSDDSDDSM